jgi:hypothetical protein
VKYKHVFLLWFWADLILVIGGLIALFGTNMLNGFKNTDFGMTLLVFGYGLVLSLPSLIVMLIFHYFYSKKSLLKKNYFKVYSLVVIAINILYALCSYFIFKMQGEFGLLFIFTTIAGFIALYLVHLKIKKEERREMIA